MCLLLVKCFKDSNYCWCQYTAKSMEGFHYTLHSIHTQREREGIEHHPSSMVMLGPQTPIFKAIVGANIQQKAWKGFTTHCILYTERGG